MYTQKSGHIESDDHKIYWEDWGNPKMMPIFVFHGGPGGEGCDEHIKTIFNPEKQRVIFHDQRGSGKSLPFSEIKNNTTQNLIKDVELIREHLGIEKMYITGGSWGSALTLFYALAHPERVERILVWSLFLARQFEVDFVNEGFPKYFFPEAWERFISIVPEKNRKTGDDVMQYYADKIRSTDEKEARIYADEWTLWEMSLCSVHYDPAKLEKETIGNINNVSIAKLETHYFLNKCFVSENYILDNIEKIKHIPCVVIQGRFDFCTPPISAFDLKKAYGKNLELISVNSGHFSSDPEMSVTLKETLINFFNKDLDN